jgi:SAM-dependent methyltransferase
MQHHLLERLHCPASGQPLLQDREGLDGWLVSADGHHRYPVRGGIPRFVPQSNYADNFGMQWNHFAKTQLDSHSGHTISADRFWKATGWNPAEMKDKWVLDVGCGSGRFAEVALAAGAHVVALDYSSAVDACAANLGHHPRFHVVQGDIYALPFAPASFDFVYSLGVLQHTPDVARAFAALPPMLAGGGDFAWITTSTPGGRRRCIRGFGCGRSPNAWTGGACSAFARRGFRRCSPSATPSMAFR